ncbi:MAG: type II secretion system protein [Candidatus Levybacteria bacterium]|nr:type II secretion system protein [Candidatus Levybacteria bacterium]
MNRKKYSGEIINHYSSIINLKTEGFTLIELVVVITVLVAIGSIVVGVITFSLRGTNKTNTIENIRQNGNYAISQIGRTIGFAESFNGFSDDNFATPAIMQCPAGATTPYKYIRIKPFNSTPIIYSCAGTPITIASDSGSFIDTSTIEVPSCSFTCTVSGTSDVPVIGIKFELKPKGSSNLVESSNPPILFETSVTMRNYQR